MAVQFTDYAGRYLLHCHNLEHEDMGLKDAGVFGAGAALQCHRATAKYVHPATSKLPRGSKPPSEDRDLHIGGYYLITSDTEDEALSWARKMPA